MAKFGQNNNKNIGTRHTAFELNYDYQLPVFFEKNTKLYSYPKKFNMLVAKLHELLFVYQKNLYHN